MKLTFYTRGKAAALRVAEALIAERVSFTQTTERVRPRIDRTEVPCEGLVQGRRLYGIVRLAAGKRGVA